MFSKILFFAAGLICVSTPALSTCPSPPQPLIQIASGYTQANYNGSVSASFIDNSVSGGTASTAMSSAAVDTTRTSTDFYPATYDFERTGTFTYTLNNACMLAGTSYLLKLHFAEIDFTAAGQRKFNVSVNGTLYLSNFDIIAEAGRPTGRSSRPILLLRMDQAISSSRSALDRYPFPNCRALRCSLF